MAVKIQLLCKNRAVNEVGWLIIFKLLLVKQKMQVGKQLQTLA